MLSSREMILINSDLYYIVSIRNRNMQPVIGSTPYRGMDANSRHGLPVAWFGFYYIIRIEYMMFTRRGVAWLVLLRCTQVNGRQTDKLLIWRTTVSNFPDVGCSFATRKTRSLK